VPTEAKGGSVYFEAVSDIGALSPYTSRKEIYAEDGKNGRGQFIDGRAGEDLILKVPTGTTIKNTDTGEEIELTKGGERLLILRGGLGGKGEF
jgi:GTP-binding protein